MSQRPVFAPLLATLMALFIAVYSGGAAAKVIDNLYRVTVDIDAQTRAEVNRASHEALAELFVRVSGHEAVLQNDAIVDAIGKANRYTKQFSYQHVTDADGNDHLQVVLEFEPSMVEDTLRKADLPLWSSNRPTVLVWLVVEDGDGRRFASADKDAALIDAIQTSARRRGLAVQLPLLDLQDLVALSPDDVWEQNYVKVDQAAERYDADTLLVGRVTHLTNGRWLGNWSFKLNGMRRTFDDDAADASGYIASALDRVAETLATEYAIKPVKMAQDGVLLRLTDVRNFVDYARAMKYLNGVVAIRHVNVISLEGDELIIRLIADGKLPQLQQAFSLDKRLQPAATDYTGPYPVTLSYRWPSTAPAGPGQADASNAVSAAPAAANVKAPSDTESKTP